MVAYTLLLGHILFGYATAATALIYVYNILFLFSS